MIAIKLPAQAGRRYLLPSLLAVALATALMPSRQAFAGEICVVEDELGVESTGGSTAVPSNALACGTSNDATDVQATAVAPNASPTSAIG